MTTTQDIWTEPARGIDGGLLNSGIVERHSTDETVARITARRDANRTATIVAGAHAGITRADADNVRWFAIEAATPSEYQWRNAR